MLASILSSNQALFYFDLMKAHSLLPLIKWHLSVSRCGRAHTVAIKFSVNCLLKQQTAKRGFQAREFTQVLPSCLFGLEHKPSWASKSQGTGRQRALLGTIPPPLG